MSWDADLMLGADAVCSWNYTHNCNRMMATVLEEAGYELTTPWFSHLGKNWWDALHGLNGEKGAVLLTFIIRKMEDARTRFKAMEPTNGWG